MKVDLPDIKSVKSGSTNVKKICHGFKELWPDYQQYILYDWIQNTSPAYLNTGINAHGEWKYVLKINITDSGKLNTWMPVAGVCDWDKTYTKNNGTGATCINALWFNKNSRGTQSVRYYYNGNKELFDTNFSLNVGDTLIYTNNPYGKYLSIERITSAGVSTLQQKTNCTLTVPSGELTTHPFCLFSKLDSGNLDPDRSGETYPCKFYYFKIYDGATNNLIHNFLPANKDGIPGMVDTVTGNFITNANSSGTLTLGND